MACPLVTRADHAPDAKAGPLPGHSMRGDTFDDGPRRTAYVMAGTGAVHFPITCKSIEGRRFFEQGVGQLHGFWYLEAERSFRQVAALDPDCALAYWGMAMANLTNVKRAKGFVAETVKRKDAARLSAKEIRWIDALALLYADEPKADGVRKRNFLAAMKTMIADFPDDVEVKALWVRHAWEYRNVSETKLTDYAAADKLLDEVFKAVPDHPAHHYRIHLWDDKDSKKSLASAARLGPAAPGVAHMWHMPGHPYSKLQRYADATWQQEASARVDHAYMIRDRVMPYEIHNYAHNNEWLVRDLAFVGRVKDAIELARNMVELPRHPKYNLESNRGSGAEYGRSRLLDVFAQHEMWPEFLAACEPGGPLAEDGDAEQRVRKLRYQGVASAATGRPDQAKTHLATLRDLRAKAVADAAKAATQPASRPTTRPATTTRPLARSTTAPTTRTVAQAATTSPTSRPTTNPRRGGGSNDRVAQVDRAIAHIDAQLALTSGEFAKAAELLEKAQARKEHLAHAYLKSGNQAKAEELAKKAVDGGKGETYPLANQVAVLHAIGKPADARAAMTKLRELSADIDLTVPAYARLAPIAIEMGPGADWRQPRVAAKDLGARPPLETLGPIHWRPPYAPDWAAPVAGGGPSVSLAAYRGRPVIVLFYLGHGCLHCAEQLNAFAPAVKEFAAAGISLVAVSTDAPATLNKAWDKYAATAPVALAPGAASFPFPLVSDAGLDLFRKYHCFDDFENAPLHGTFLIDADGLIRWRDIGAQPFTDVKFLVKEARRLLPAK